MNTPALGTRADFRRLVDHLDGVALWIVSEPGEFEYVSEGLEDIWGIPVEAIESNPHQLLESIHPEDRDRIRSSMLRPASEVTDESYESRVVQPDGTVRWVHTRVVPLWNDDGSLRQIVGISTDVTTQKRQAQELETLNQIVRHDIRNDMSIILGWAELLEPHVDEAGERHLEKILASGQHIIELTESAREYVKALSDGEELAIKPTPLRSTLENEVALRRESFSNATIVISTEIPPVEVRANELLSSVFRNLINNAVQHNDSAEPTVEITCDHRPGTVRVSIRDNGPGIRDEHKDDIFGEGEHGLTSAGTGVGLYLVKTLIEQYDGSITVEDGETGGAVFHVTLPLVE